MNESKNELRAYLNRHGWSITSECGKLWSLTCSDGRFTVQIVVTAHRDGRRADYETLWETGAWLA